MKKGYTITILCLLLALCVLGGLIYFDLFHGRDTAREKVDIHNFMQAMQEVEDSKTIGGHLWIQTDPAGEPELFRYDQPLTFTVRVLKENKAATLQTTLKTEYVTHEGYYELYYDGGWKLELTDGKPVMNVEETTYHYDKMDCLEVTLQAADGNPTAAQLEEAAAVIERRLADRNAATYEADVNAATGEIYLRFPWADTDSAAVQELLAELTVKGTLQFYEGEGTVTSGGEAVPPRNGTPILEGEDVTSATAMVNTDPLTSVQSPYVVALELSDAGADEFAAATQRLAPNHGVVSIWLDYGEKWSKEYYKPRYALLAAPTVESPIMDGEAHVTGFASYAEAEEIAHLINGGDLPIELTCTHVSVIKAEDK